MTEPTRGSDSAPRADAVERRAGGLTRVASPEVIVVHTFDDLVRLDASIQYDRPSLITFLFRGQARAEWPLVPSLTRRMRACGLAVPQALALEHSARLAFQAQAHLHLQLLSEPEDVVTWWLFMQHYNAPTRLLDWTRSLFVAAYFAVEKEEESDGAIWIVHAARLVDETRKRHGLELPTEWKAARSLFLNSDAPPGLFHVTVTAQTDRMVAQQMGFTASPAILADHGEILTDYFGDGDPTKRGQFVKAIIPATSKPEILLRLRRVNITAQALFPGIDGLGRSIAELVRCESDVVRAAGRRG